MHDSSLKPTKQSFTVSAWKAALICSIMLAVYMTIGLVFPGVGLLKRPLFAAPLFVLIAVCVCTWLAQRGKIELVSRDELRQIFIGTAVAFVVLDEGFVLLNQWLNPSADHPRFPVATAIVAVVIDVVLVAVIVYLTVPIAARMYRRNVVAQLSASCDRSNTRST